MPDIILPGRCHEGENYLYTVLTVSECEYRSVDVIRAPAWLFAVVRIYRVVTAGRIIPDCLNHMDIIRCSHLSGFNKYYWWCG